MKNILIPTDFSENAWNAIDYALQFLKDEKCTFYIVNTYTPTFYRPDYWVGGPVVSGIPDKGVDISLSGLENTLKRMQDNYVNSNHTFTTLSAFNTLYDEIREICEDKKIDLVVMGTQGASGMQEILFGSNTVHVLQKASVPVLAIPAGFPYTPSKHILFPTDFEIDYTKANLDALLWLSKLGCSNINIMHVSAPGGLTPAQQNKKAHLESMMTGSIHTMHDWPDQELIGAINKFQEKTPVDLLVMVKNKHSFWERLFIEPIIKKIGFHCNVPFLVLPYYAKP